MTDASAERARDVSEYRVLWEITIDADSPEQAARRAYDAFCRPGSTAHIFDVSRTLIDDAHGSAVGQVTVTTTVDIDNGWEPGCPGAAVGYPMTEEG